MKNNYNKLKQEKGVTLIALVVTIIVLMIIAGLTITATVGGSGIINRVQQAQEDFENKKEEEQRKIEETRNKLNTAVGDVSSGKTAKDGNSRYVDSNGKKAVVPQGFTVSGKDGENTIDNGLVIYNTNGQEVEDWDAVTKTTYDQWVWIPVSNASDMYETNLSGVALYGNTGVKTNRYSKSVTLGNRTIDRVMPGNTTGFREPDLVVGDGTQWDAQYYADAGFTSLSNMANSLANDYKEMLDSVRKYGGFYIGRYELTGTIDNPTEKSGTVLETQNWYNLYKACKNLGSNNEVVETRMVWGNQWDEICKFISTKGDKVDLDDSREYGNYNNSTGNAATYSGVWVSKTGRSEYWKTNNIYDLAGNAWEWTQEAYSYKCRSPHGGSLANDGTSCSVNYYNKYDLDTAFASLSTRPTMYIKTTN